MKRRIRIAFCLVMLCLAATLLLVACADEGQEPTHDPLPVLPEDSTSAPTEPTEPTEPTPPAQDDPPVEVPDEPCTHAYGEWQQTVAPSCGAMGEQSRTCTLCGESESKTLPKQGAHTFMADRACGVCGTAMDEGFLFELNEDGASYAFRYDGNGAMVTVPSTFDGLPVTRLNTGAFYWKTELVSVTLPDSITVIDNEAFKASANLKSVNIPTAVTVIGKEAFSGCLALTKITLPKGVTRIEYATFSDSGLRSIALHEGITYIGEEAFLGCRDLTQITIPASVCEMGKNAFNACSNLKTVTFAKGSQLTVIPQSAFSSNSALSSISLPEGITTIEKQAFAYLGSLTRVELPSTLTSLGDEVFRNSGKDPMTIIYRGTQQSWETVERGKKWDQIFTYSGKYTMKFEP